MAIEKKEADKLLRGEKEYEIEVSEFISDVFPTDINSVLVNCFYKQKGTIANIDAIFQNALIQLLNGTACDRYIALLYFDTCIYQEEIGKATFALDKKSIGSIMKCKLEEEKKLLQDKITYANGLSKSNAWETVIRFDRYYHSKYNFSILN